MDEPNEQDIQHEEAVENDPPPDVGGDPADLPQQGKRHRVVAPDPEDRPDEERE